MADLVFRSTTRGGRDYFEVTDDGMAYGGNDRYNIRTDESMDYASTVDEVLAKLVFDGAWRVNYDKIEVDELGIGKEYKEIVKEIRAKYNYLYNAPKGSAKKVFYFDIGRYFKNGLSKGIKADKIFNMIDDYIRTNEELLESKRSARKSMKEYRSMGFEGEIRDTLKNILEDSNEDLFDLGMCSEVVMTYDNRGRAEITGNGDVYIDYLTIPPYAWSSGFTPKNKKLAKLFDDWQEMNFESARERIFDEYEDELAELGITDKDDDNLEYNSLYDLGAGDIAERLSEYEMDLEGMDCYTVVSCDLITTDEGVELTVSMQIQDAYGHILVKDYKPNTILIEENYDDLEDLLRDAIKTVTEQF